MADTKYSDNVSKDVIVKEALEKFQTSNEGTDENRNSYYEDTKFARMADQWPQEIKAQRDQESRPALTINKMPVYIRSVVNEARMSKPAVQVGPVDNGADEDSAEVIGGLIKSIERNSNADVAYTTALDHAVTGGFGFWEIGIDYAHDDSFELEARINRISNALMVHWDPSSTEFDASDWGYAFISEWMTKEEYMAQYPDASWVDFEGSASDELTEQWVDDEMIRLAAYWERSAAQRKLLMLQAKGPDGQTNVETIREEQLPVMAKRFFEVGNMPTKGLSEKDLVAGFMQLSGVQVLRERTVEYHKVVRRVINGSEVLEENPWPGSTIPICPVWGDEVYIDGRRRFRSLIRDAKDSQTMFNFWRSATTELVALAPKAPWLMPKGSIAKGDEERWRTANSRSHPYLEYEQVPGAPPPQRQPFAGVPAGALQEALTAADDIKSTMGIFDASIGARSNETSGKAILARERQGDVTNYHFIDNWSRAIRYCGRVLTEIIPAVYSTKETIRILGEDDAEKVVKLTQQAGGAKQPGPDGQQALYNLSVGKYDVTVKKGPSFQTQREETRETLIEIMRAIPASAQFVGDQLLEHMDFVGADKIARRLRHLLPPEIRAIEEAEEKSDNPEVAAANAKVQQMTQMIEAGKKELERLNQENEQLKGQKQSDAAKQQAEIQRMQVDAQLDTKAATQKDQELQLKAEELEVKKTEVALKYEVDKAKIDEQTRQRRDQMAAEGKPNADMQENEHQAILGTVLEQHQGTRELMGALIANMNAPKEIIKDEEGRPVGVRTITE